jgi:hypothetical protein
VASAMPSPSTSRRKLVKFICISLGPYPEEPAPAGVPKDGPVCA